MKFLCLAYGSEEGWDALSETEQSELLAQDARIRVRGALMSAVEPQVTSVSSWDRERSVTTRSDLDGPDLPLAGFSVIEADSIDEVVAMVSDTPCARAGGRIEIRPFWGEGDVDR